MILTLWLWIPSISKCTLMCSGQGSLVKLKRKSQVPQLAQIWWLWHAGNWTCHRHWHLLIWFSRVNTCLQNSLLKFTVMQCGNLICYPQRQFFNTVPCKFATFTKGQEATAVFKTECWNHRRFNSSWLLNTHIFTARCAYHVLTVVLPCVCHEAHLGRWTETCWLTISQFSTAKA